MKNLKTTLTTIAILLLTFSASAQNNKGKYYQKMGQTLGEFANCKTIEDFNNLSNQFLVISKVEKEEWLPLYYAAHCKIIMSFIETEDKIKKDAYLDDAEIIFDSLKTIAPEESEIYALKALFNTARLVVDPTTRGQEYAMLSNEEASKSLALNNNNLRAKYILLANKIGFAQFFGKEITEECKEGKELLAEWDSVKNENPLAPSWGKDLVEGLIKSCK